MNCPVFILKREYFVNKILITLTMLLLPGLVLASTVATERLVLTSHPIGYAALAIFVIAYLFVMAEEFTHLRKSKPVILAAGIIWALIGYIYASHA